jgi:hypothetical protein
MMSREPGRLPAGCPGDGLQRGHDAGACRVCRGQAAGGRAAGRHIPSGLPAHTEGARCARYAVKPRARAAMIATCGCSCGAVAAGFCFERCAAGRPRPLLPQPQARIFTKDLSEKEVDALAAVSVAGERPSKAWVSGLPPRRAAPAPLQATRRPVARPRPLLSPRMLAAVLARIPLLLRVFSLLAQPSDSGFRPLAHAHTLTHTHHIHTHTHTHTHCTHTHTHACTHTNTTRVPTLRRPRSDPDPTPSCPPKKASPLRAWFMRR